MVTDWQRKMRMKVVEEGLELEANADAIISLVTQQVVASARACRAFQKGKCCDNCNCVSFADLLHEITH